MEKDVEIVALADELKALVGWGSEPKRLPLQAALASLAQVPDGMGFVPSGYLIRRFLVEAVDSISEPVELAGRTISPEQLRRVVRLLLMIEGSGQSAVNRRYRALQVLGFPTSLDQWRRPGGLEYQLMLLVAEQIAKPPQLTTA